MLDLNPKTIIRWSRLGSRTVLGLSLISLVESNDDVVVVSADLGKSSGLARLQSGYNNKLINVGISEQNMIGVSAGLAKEGFIVYCTSFAPFISMRASEQIRMNMGYMEMNIKAIALGSGFAMSYLGNSHYGLEDLSYMRSIPNLTVVSPADCGEIVKTINAASTFQGPMYIRLTGESNIPIVYKDDYDFEIGKAVVLREGSDISIISTGSMVYESLEAAKILESRGISVSVINMHTIKPLDSEVLENVIRKVSLLVTVEEHSEIGGLGSAVAEFKAGCKTAPPQVILGIPDQYGKVGEHRYLLEKYGLVANKIAERIQTEFKKFA